MTRKEEVGLLTPDEARHVVYRRFGKRGPFDPKRPLEPLVAVGSSGSDRVDTAELLSFGARVQDLQARFSDFQPPQNSTISTPGPGSGSGVSVGPAGRGSRGLAAIRDERNENEEDKASRPATQDPEGAGAVAIRSRAAALEDFFKGKQEGGFPGGDRK